MTIASGRRWHVWVVVFGLTLAELLARPGRTEHIELTNELRRILAALTDAPLGLGRTLLALAGAFVAVYAPTELLGLMLIPSAIRWYVMGTNLPVR